MHTKFLYKHALPLSYMMLNKKEKMQLSIGGIHLGINYSVLNEMKWDK